MSEFFDDENYGGAGRSAIFGRLLPTNDCRIRVKAGRLSKTVP